MCVCPMVMVSMFFSQEEGQPALLKWQKKRKQCWPVACKSTGWGRWC